MLTEKELIFILAAYDEECLYDPSKDPDSSVFFNNAKRSYRARRLLRNYLESQGVNLPRPANQPIQELEKLERNAFGQTSDDQVSQRPDERGNA